MSRKILSLLFIAYCLLLVSAPLGARAQDIDLLWQGDTYTPPFYEGRALWSSQSRITFLAIPHGLGNQANLNYRWTKSGTVLGNSSGVGRSSLSFTDSIVSRPQTIKVDIMSSQGEILATASTNVAPITPTLTVYENNPLYGFMFHRETSGAHQLQDKEVTFAAFPFFFDTIDRTSETMNYEWRTNARDTQTGGMVTYRTPDNASGSSEIQVHASNINKILQNSSKTFLVEFENQ